MFQAFECFFELMGSLGVFLEGGSYVFRGLLLEFVLSCFQSDILDPLKAPKNQKSFSEVQDGSLVADWNERLIQEGDLERTIKPFDRLMSFNDQTLERGMAIKK